MAHHHPVDRGQCDRSQGGQDYRLDEAAATEAEQALRHQTSYKGTRHPNQDDHDGASGVVPQHDLLAQSSAIYTYRGALELFSKTMGKTQRVPKSIYPALSALSTP